MEVEKMLKRIMADNGNFVSREKAEECLREIKELGKILKSAICFKGCGAVKIEMAGGIDPTCSECGEELERYMTSEHIKYLAKTSTR